MECFLSQFRDPDDALLWCYRPSRPLDIGSWIYGVSEPNALVGHFVKSPCVKFKSLEECVLLHLGGHE